MSVRLEGTPTDDGGFYFRCDACRSERTLRRNVWWHPCQKMQRRCKHLGKPTGQLVDCQTGCKGTKFKVFACAVHGGCLPNVPGQGLPSCPCPEYA